MKIPKYSKLEIERKWLVSENYKKKFENEPHTLIEDCYLNCGRLRLRSMTDSKTREKVFKLCKKYGAISNNEEPITNIYLSENEFRALSILEGKTVIKKRYKKEFNGTLFSVDIFEGELDGLILCEIESERQIAIDSIGAPPIAILEVTSILEFTGGELCRLSNNELRKILNEMEKQFT